MDQAKFIARLNIERYQQMLASETDPNKLETITRLLAEQTANLQEMERKERETIARQLAEQESELLQEKEHKRA